MLSNLKVDAKKKTNSISSKQWVSLVLLIVNILMWFLTSIGFTNHWKQYHFAVKLWSNAKEAIISKLDLVWCCITPSIFFSCLLNYSIQWRMFLLQLQLIATLSTRYASKTCFQVLQYKNFIPSENHSKPLKIN